MARWWKQDLWPTLKGTLKHWIKDDGGLLSAALAYYAAFSMFPLCLVLIACLGYVMRFSPAVQNERQELISMVAEATTDSLAEQLDRVLEQVQAQASIGGPVGLAAIVLAAIGIFAQLEAVFDRIWDTKRAPPAGLVGSIRRVLIDRLVAFLMLLGLGALVIVIFLSGFVLTALRRYAVELPAGQYAWQVGQMFFTLTVNCLLFAALYKILSNAPLGWKEPLAGGLFAAVIWGLGQQVLAAVVIGEKYSAYGVVGAFIAVMLWMYYASAVLLLGGEFVRASWHQSKAASAAKSTAAETPQSTA